MKSDKLNLTKQYLKDKVLDEVAFFLRTESRVRGC